GDGQCGDLGGCGPCVHDDLKRMRRFLTRQRMPLRELADIGLDGVDHVSSTKFLSSACPCSDAMDSGWNCTPNTGCSLCWSPMIRIRSFFPGASLPCGLGVLT